jgi:hypothetical protein
MQTSIIATPLTTSPFAEGMSYVYIKLEPGKIKTVYTLHEATKNTYGIREIINSSALALIFTQRGSVESIFFHPKLNLNNTNRFLFVNKEETLSLLISEETQIKCYPESQYDNLVNKILASTVSHIRPEFR